MFREKSIHALRSTQVPSIGASFGESPTTLHSLGLRIGKPGSGSHGPQIVQQALLFNIQDVARIGETRRREAEMALVSYLSYLALPGERRKIEY
jgi:hypothetical protein